MLIVLLMGFSSGLPLLLIGGTLKAWMRDDGLDLTTIGFFSLVGLPYTFKFIWAPLMDRYVPPFLGRRRGWLLVSQLLLMGALIGISVLNPTTSLGALSALAVVIAFFSASQDIVADAYRREILKDEELGFGSSLFINGYRFAMYIAQSGALIIAGLVSWDLTYKIMGLLMGVGILTTLFAREPETGAIPPRTIREAVIGPFHEFFSRKGSLTILAFILFYKLGDTMASEMLNPFYLDMGFSLVEIGAIAKTIGLAGTLGGAAVGGLIILKTGMKPALWLFGFLQAASTALFVLLVYAGHSISTLSLVIGVETVTGGMGMAAYAGYMASVTNRKFTATQMALLTSLMGVPRVFFGATTGYLAETLGWAGFFILCTAIAAPGLLLLHRIAPLWRRQAA